ncbi:uncharacterized protein LOC108665078 isoform X2 [Hyalella azteca]|nr:uncharacterized protein LOC108665078 isoform X2 [Hyalella azteca]
MMHVARECRGNHSSSPASGAAHQHSLLSFGEFCLLSTDLQRGYRAQPPASDVKQSPPPPPLISRQCSDRGPGDPATITAKKTAPCEVFLGGSCNPTSWRQDVAIPTLRALGISFYNPQVTHWEEALLEREHQAKSSASVLFFVFDRRTRNVASMVEVAYMAALPRKIILVLDTYPGPGHIIEGEPMSKREFEELSGGLNTVQDLVERRGIPVFSQLPHALSCTAKVLREDIWPQQLGACDNVTLVRHPELHVSPNLTKLQTAYRGRAVVSLGEASKLFSSVTGRLLSQEELLTIIAAKKGVSGSSVSVDSSELALKEVTLTLEELSCVVAEFSEPRAELRRIRDVFTNSVVTPLQRALGFSSPRRSLRHARREAAMPVVAPTHKTVNGGPVHPVDVYLGGTYVQHDAWRNDVAEPFLRKHGLTFCSPFCINNQCNNQLFTHTNSNTELPVSPDLHSNSNPREADSCLPVQKYPVMHCNSSSRVASNSSRSSLNSHDVVDENRTSVTGEFSLPRNTSPDRRKNSRSVVNNCRKMSAEVSTDSSECACLCPEVLDGNGRLLPSEAANVDKCHVLLFVISNKTRSVSAMAMAAHYVGLGRKVVLCVQDLTVGSPVDGEMLSKYATKDYNRGRSYLTDLARKDGVPVFDDLAAALECVAKICAER